MKYTAVKSEDGIRCSVYTAKHVAIRSDGDMRKYLLNFFNEPHSAQELESKTTFDLLITFLDWRERRIAPRPRRVHCSEALLNNPLLANSEYKLALDKIIDDLKLGNNIAPHLSDKIQYAYKQPPRTPKSKPRKALDKLLNDWGIHHLHLSTELWKDGFTKRTTHLLFAVFRDDDAYLINILDHQSWTDISLCEIMVRQWPNANLMHEINGLTGENLVNEERKSLRNSNINVCLSIDGKSYFPRGLMASGHSMSTVRQAQHMLNVIKQGVTLCFSELVDKISLKNSA